jgi:hypothetical protein
MKCTSHETSFYIIFIIIIIIIIVIVIIIKGSELDEVWQEAK